MYSKIFDLIMSKIEEEQKKVVSKEEGRTIEDDMKSIYASKKLLEVAREMQDIFSKKHT